MGYFGVPLGGSGGGDPAGPTLVVGNVPAGDPDTASDTYYPDAGDGVQLRAALDAAALLADGGTVYVRRGTYTPAAANLPLPITGVRVVGDGPATIINADAVERRLFTGTASGGRAPVLRDIHVALPDADPTASGAAVIDFSAAEYAEIDHVDVVSDSVGISDDANESITSVFSLGLSARLEASRTIDINGNSGLVYAVQINDERAIVQGNELVGADGGIFVASGGGADIDTNVFAESLQGLAIDLNATAGVTNIGPNTLNGASVNNPASGVVITPNTPAWHYGNKIWEWNRTDVSQFGTAVPHERDLGGGTKNAATALIPSVLTGQGNPYDVLLRLTATSLQGGGAIPIQNLTLPDRFVMRWIFANQTGGLFPMIYLGWAVDGSGDFQGFGTQRSISSASSNIRAIVNDRTGNAESMVNSGSFSNPTIVDRGGIEQITQVYKRQNGEATAYARLAQFDFNGASNTQARDTSLPHTISGVSTNWDNLDFSNIGPGCYEGINGTSGTVDIALLEIYEMGPYPPGA